MNLNGKYFQSAVSDGKKVRKGDLLMEVDLQELIKEDMIRPQWLLLQIVVDSKISLLVIRKIIKQEN